MCRYHGAPDNGHLSRLDMDPYRANRTKWDHVEPKRPNRTMENQMSLETHIPQTFIVDMFCPTIIGAEGGQTADGAPAKMLVQSRVRWTV